MTSSRRFAPVVVLFTSLGMVSSGAGATILLFDQTRDAATQTTVVETSAGAPVAQDYGDRVTGALHTVPGGQFTYGEAGEGFTPNIEVRYYSDSSTDAGVSLWTTDYGDLHNVAFGAPNSYSLNISLVADPGFEVLLYGFDLAGWSNADYVISTVRVWRPESTVFADESVHIDGDGDDPRHTTFAFASPLRGPDLLIQVDYGNLPGGLRDNIGIDNIRFGQTPPAPVPEPATIALFVVGLFVVAGCHRRGPSWRQRISRIAS